MRQNSSNEAKMLVKDRNKTTKHFFFNDIQKYAQIVGSKQIYHIDWDGLECFHSHVVLEAQL
jgi:hypothetical protein